MAVTKAIFNKGSEVIQALCPAQTSVLVELQ
jgi:hypothetical protein